MVLMYFDYWYNLQLINASEWGLNGRFVEYEIFE